MESNIYIKDLTKEYSNLLVRAILFIMTSKLMFPI